MRDFTREIKKLKLKKGLECAECITIEKILYFEAFVRHKFAFDVEKK